MKHKRAWLVAAVLTAACHSSSPPARPAPPAPTPAAKHGPTDDLSLLPIDSEIVFGVDFSQLSHSAIWQKYFASKIGDFGGIEKFKTLCGFDPLASLQSLAVGFRDVNAANPTGMIVLHGYDRAKSMTCFDNEGLAEVQKDGTKVVIDGQVVMLSDSDPKGRNLGFTFVDDRTAVAVLGADGASKDSIQRATAGVRGLNGSPAFVEMYDQLNRRDTMWMLVRGKSLSELEALGVKAKALFGSVNVTSGITIDARIRLTTPDEANQLVTMLQAQIANPQVKTLFDQLDINADGSDIHIALAMSEDKVAAFAGLIGGILGGGGP
jgi:hypothetical protein